MSMKNVISLVRTSVRAPSLKRGLSLMIVACLTMCLFVFGAGASSANEVVTMAPYAAIDAASDIFGQITQTVNFANIAKVLGIGLGAVLGIWLAWWGLRKLFRMLQGVINGKGIKF